MIRVLQEADIDRVAEIWLDSNLKAHHFIPAQYWKSNFGLVKEMLSQAEVYVYENDRNIQGFTGLNGEYPPLSLSKNLWRMEDRGPFRL